MSSATQENVGWTLGFYALLLVLVVFAIAAPTLDGSGRHVNNHTTSMPTSFQTLDANKTFIVPMNIDPSWLCGNGADAHGGVAQQRPLPKLHAQYVQCDNSITWNDHRGMSRSYAHALVTIFTSWVFIGITVAYFLLTFFFGILPGVRNERAQVKHSRKLAKQQAERTLATLEQKRLELVKAYSDDKLDDAEFGHAMDRLYEQGLPPAKDVNHKPLPREIRELG